jgi:hypothetical protein
VDSSENMPFSHCVGVHLRYFLQKASLFFIIPLVSRGFLAAGCRIFSFLRQPLNPLHRNVSKSKQLLLYISSIFEGIALNKKPQPFHHPVIYPPSVSRSLYWAVVVCSLAISSAP